MPKKPVDTSTARRLAELRHARGLSQRELARRCGWTEGTVWNHERGRGHVTTAQLRRYADVLGIKPAVLLEEPGALLPRQLWHRQPERGKPHRRARGDGGGAKLDHGIAARIANVT